MFFERILEERDETTNPALGKNRTEKKLIKQSSFSILGSSPVRQDLPGIVDKESQGNISIDDLKLESGKSRLVHCPFTKVGLWKVS